MLASVAAWAQTPIDDSDGKKFLASLQGTYIELFTDSTCLAPQYNTLWHDTAAKCVGVKDADSMTKALIDGCTGTLTGQQAVTEYAADPASARFCCAFLDGVTTLTFSGDTISGHDCGGQEVFSAAYTLLRTDSDGNRTYAASTDTPDEFRYFWIRPDSPAETHHIELRYGSDPEQLPLLYTGPYAYWMASGVRQGKADEYRNSIILFIEENLCQPH